MAYNLQSLISILEHILNPQQTRWILDDENKSQLESLLEKAASLQQILQKSSLPNIETQIREAAHEAEDIIESHMVNQMLSRPDGESFAFFIPDLDLQQVTQQLDSAMKQVVKLMEGKKMSSGSSSSGASDVSSRSVVVGVDKDLQQLMDRLTGEQRKLEIVPIVGMGGIGKTTLARKLYQDPVIVEYFTYRAWTTISQEYDMRAILSSLLRCITGQEFDQHIDELKDILHKRLFGRRYMIVLDDIWSTQFWDEIRIYFPDNNMGSRIVITTRESDVAKYADSQSQQHQVQPLSKSVSWDLLRQIVFGEEDCLDHVLQEIGRKIASDCGGLPLAINVIGGLLSKLERSEYVWENIGKDVRAAIAESDEQFSNILSLSYNYLPNHLRPCFLYMGAFPEEIKGSRLIQMWVGEGFVKSNKDKSLEEEGEIYLKALVARNLVLVDERKSNGKAMSYSMHDLMRDVSMRKAEEEKFLHVYVKNAPNKVTFCKHRRVSADPSDGMEDVNALAESMPLVRSFLCRETEIVSHAILYALRLVRVLDVFEMEFGKFPEEILQLVNLRCLALICKSGGLPIGISRLCNLQTLIARLPSHDVPSEFWEMSELRHVKLVSVIDIEEGYMMKFGQMKKLRRIHFVRVTRWLIRSGFFESIPNIRELGIYFDEDCSLSSEGVDLSHLHKLQTLRCETAWYKSGGRSLRTLRFPCNLRKLTLFDCVIYPVVLTTLCTVVPNLEVLKIGRCVFKSEETDDDDDDDDDDDQVWEVPEGDEFRSLEHLNLGQLKLVRWRADETNFPRLRHLSIKDCTELEEIPSGIGNISTLQLIQLLDGCSPRLVASAKQIQEVQQSDYDNHSLQLAIYDDDDDDDDNDDDEDDDDDDDGHDEDDDDDDVRVAYWKRVVPTPEGVEL